MPTKPEAAFRITKLTREFDRLTFDCGKPKLNDYLKKFALQHQKKGVTATYVAFASARPTVIAGFYSVCTAHVNFQNVPAALSKGLPKHPIPALRLAQLAVDKAYARQGLGAYLVGSAIHQAASLSRRVGLALILVDALDEEAALFYERLGFVRLIHNPWVLCFHLEDFERPPTQETKSFFRTTQPHCVGQSRASAPARRRAP